MNRSTQKINAIGLGIVIAFAGIVAIGGNPGFILGPKSFGIIAIALVFIFLIPDRKSS